jgi:hypothetical protein
VRSATRTFSTIILIVFCTTRTVVARTHHRAPKSTAPARLRSMRIYPRRKTAILRTSLLIVGSKVFAVGARAILQRYCLIHSTISRNPGCARYDLCSTYFVRSSSFPRRAERSSEHRSRAPLHCLRFHWRATNADYERAPPEGRLALQ